MNRKTLIQIIVIVIGFGGAAWVLYNGLAHKAGPLPAAPVSAPGPTSTTQTLLPYGDNLAGELKRVLQRNGLKYELVDYPKLDAGEVGIAAQDLIKPLPAAPSKEK